MQGRLRMHQNLILGFYRKKVQFIIRFFFPAVPLAVEIRLLTLEGVYRKVSKP